MKYAAIVMVVLVIAGAVLGIYTAANARIQVLSVTMSAASGDEKQSDFAVLQQAMGTAPAVFLVGEEFSRASRTLHADPKQVKAFPDIEALKAFLQENPVQGRTILIKGSNGNHMQRVVDVL